MTDTRHGGRREIVTILPVNPTLVFVHWHLDETVALAQTRKGRSPWLQFDVRLRSAADGLTLREPVSASRGSGYFRVPDATVVVAVHLGYGTEGDGFEPLVSSADIQLFPPTPVAVDDPGREAASVWTSGSPVPVGTPDITALTEHAFSYGVSSGAVSSAVQP